MEVPGLGSVAVVGVEPFGAACAGDGAVAGWTSATRAIATGAPPVTIDDALQTAALRALCRHEGFDSFNGLVSWVIVVAWD